MRRRVLFPMVMLVLGLTWSPIWGQQQARIPVVGILVPSIPQNHPALEALRNRLQELGYVAPQSIKYEYRSAQGELQRLTGLAQELVRLKVDVIVAATEPAIEAARSATNSIPIVMVAYSSDPKASRFVESLSRPGGNVTGIYTRGSELLGKRLELLKEIMPSLSRVAVFWDPFNVPNEHDELEHAARTLQIELEHVQVRTPDDTNGAITLARRKRAEAGIIPMSPVLYMRIPKIAQEALANRLPVMGSHDFTRAGGLLSYGTDLRDNYHRAAHFVDQLLKGAKPGDLPVEQVVLPKLVINLKTARALNIVVPQSVLLRADEVIK